MGEGPASWSTTGAGSAVFQFASTELHPSPDLPHGQEEGQVLQDGKAFAVGKREGGAGRTNGLEQGVEGRRPRVSRKR